MKTILAHWKKDLLSSRTLLMVWLLCVGLILAFAIVRLAGSLSPSLFQPSPNGLPKALAFFLAFFTGLVGVLGLQFLLLALLIVRIIHLDPLVDPDAWWRTRPISGLSLLGAKGLFVAMLLLGAFLSLGVMEFQSPALLPSCLTALTFVVGLVAFASLTTGLSPLILNWLGVVIGAGVLARVVLAFWRQSFLAGQGSALSLDFHVNVAASTNWASLSLSLLYLAGFLGAIFCQYLKRSTNLSRAILFVTFFLAVLLKSGTSGA